MTSPRSFLSGSVIGIVVPGTVVGVSLISRRAVEDECQAGLLGCVSVRDLDVSRAFHLVIHRERSRSPLAQAFLAFVQAQSPDRPA